MSTFIVWFIVYMTVVYMSMYGFLKLIYGDVLNKAMDLHDQIITQMLKSPSCLITPIIYLFLMIQKVFISEAEFEDILVEIRKEINKRL